MSITGFDHVAITVADVNATCAFYDKLFGVRIGHDYAPNGKTLVCEVFLGGGDTKFSVHQLGNGVNPVAKTPTPGSVDLCFRWNQPIETAVALLKKHNVAVVEGPSPRAYSDGRKSISVYFFDPDGNLIELMAPA
jgi:catechol 2,3-dioxygenase-like lactoylglutathione lyase family enzyme